MTQAILIVEDEKNLGATLQSYLNRLGYVCDLARNCVEAQEKFNAQSPSIVLMDIELPDGNGLQLARNFRKTRKDFVLLFLSAQNDPDIRVEGLELGAQDYITKPFALKELMLRLDRILKIQQEMELLPSDDEGPDVVTAGPLKIWFKRYEFQDAQGDTHPLSQKECSILKLLYSHSGEAITRDQIIENIWGEDKYPTNRTVDNYIVKLRKWCETDPEKHIDIQSVRGIGYKLNIR